MVHKTTLPDGRQVWMVKGYAEARSAFTDPRLSNDTTRMGAMDPLASLPAEIKSLIAMDMLNSDPPEHTKRRKRLAPAFTGRKIATLRPLVSGIVDEIIDALDGRRDVDLVEMYASQVSVRVLAEIVGIAAQDLENVRSWSDTFVKELLVVSDSLLDATRSLLGYCYELVARKRAAPGDDLVSQLVSSFDTADQAADDELASTVFILLIAGQTATAQLIAKALALLLTHPTQLEMLRAEPALISSAVEEVLRVSPPLSISGFRLTTEPVTIAGTTIPAGEIVICSLDDANRDETRFVAPGEFDVRREDNQHLSFGHGIHRCLGVHLARLEAEIAIGELIGRFPDARLAIHSDQLTWVERGIMRTLEALPVHLRCPTSVPVSAAAGQ
ncbi:cytochrome P450 family protein [Lentzea tibetensis]|nr:cytochrome P450 [Lentzea tibetensis]